MSSLPPPAAGRLLTAWSLDVPVAIAVGLLAAAYLVAVVVIRRRGDRWPPARTAAFVGLGLTSVVVCTMSGLATYDRVLVWPLAVQITLLLAVCPVLLALGDPLGLLRTWLGAAGRRRFDRVAASRIVRVLTFPVVAALLAVVVQFVALFTPYAAAAARHPAVRDLLYAQMLAVGCLFALPILGVELLPAWCTQPVRMLFAAVDGLLDAIPGIAVIGGAGTLAGGYYSSVHTTWTTGVFTDRDIAGGLMITLSEIVAAPLLIVLFRAWIREDADRAAEVDVVLDAARAASAGRRPELGPGSAAAATAGGGDEDAGADGGADRDRPWWEVDPGPLADRAGRYGWRRRED